MDFDGFMLLMDKDQAKFDEWEKQAKKMSTDELRISYNQWLEYFIEMKDKYWIVKSDDKIENFSILAAKLAYFMYLTSFVWFVLGAYTKKLRQDYKSLKSTKKTKKKTKPKRTI